MARIVKAVADAHVVRRIRTDDAKADIELIRGGKLAYLWTPAGTVSGPVVLRTLAYDILREVGFNRAIKKKRKSRRPDSRNQ